MTRLTGLIITMLCAVVVWGAAQGAPVAQTRDLDDRRTPMCTNYRHLYGIIKEVHGRTVLIKSTGSAGNVNLLTSQATIRPEHVAPRPGLYVRALGCFGENRQGRTVYRARYLTLGRTLRSVQLASAHPEDEARELSAAPKVNAQSTTKPTVVSVAPTQKPVVTSGEDIGSCTGYRWPVKIGADKDAGAVNGAPQDTSVAALKGIKLASLALANGRANPAETTVYRLRNVFLVRMYEEHDRDYHLLVRDRSGNQITLEAPDPSCATGSAFLSQIGAVRSTLRASQPAAGTPLTATGVGFYDSPGSGGMELHPLLSVCMGKDCTP